MVFGVKLDPEIAKSSHEMRHVFGQGRTSIPEQSLSSVKESIPVSRSEETFPLQHKNKLARSLGQPYLAPNRELRQAANTGQVAQQSWVAHKPGDGDELVKHMSNLPGFLQQVEKEKTIQDKALSVGVLDWKRLEKWKYTERMPGRSPKKTSSTSGTPKMCPSLKSQPYPRGCNPSALYSGKQSLPHVAQVNSPQRQPPPPHSLYLKDARYSSSHKEDKYVEPIKSKGNETCHQHWQASQVSAVCGQQDHFRQRVQLCQRSCSKANIDNSKRKVPRKEISLPELSQHRSSLHPAINALGRKSGMSSDDQVKFTTECCLADPPNSGLLPKHLPKNGCSGSSQFMEFRAAHDGKSLEVVGNTLSDFFSADAQHSSPRLSVPTFRTEHSMEPHHLATRPAVDLDVLTNALSSANSAAPSTTFEGKLSLIHEETSRLSSGVEGSNKTQAGFVEQPVVRGRAPSPTRRFSFSLGKLSRSGSFKDSSVAQSSSTHTNVKSGQVKPDVPCGMDNFERDKESANIRGQSSPLRRLLNPLLKFKGAQSAEPARPSNGSISTMAARTTTGTKGPSQGRKLDASCVQALLQLTLKNELPFFKLVVDNREDMLAAAVKKLPTSGKNDPCMIYTFYSVHEIRKKGMNWISQGLKSKNCSLGYKIVGQMKISNSYHLKVKAVDYDARIARECVLYGADPGQVNKQMLEFVPNKEMAAIIVKNSIKPKAEFSGMVVILPGGVHSIPIKGSPSSLISRWRSGGQCDCGGWDVGCKLQILADHRKCSSIPQASVSSSDVDRVNLFIQGDEPKSKPVFSLEPLSNGLYSVELDASISLLEAFATCVAYVTCSKFPDSMDMEGQSDNDHFPESARGTRPITFQDQLPAKYVTCPPLSPAGRI